MKFFSWKLPNVNARWSFILPLLCTTFWWAMLTALLICWAVQDRPVYSTGDPIGSLVYISNIGATNLQGLFIAGSTLQGIFSVWTFIQEKNLKEKKYLYPFVDKHHRNLQIASIVFSLLGAIGIFLVSCLKDTKFDKVHITFVGIFIVAEFFHAIMNMAAQGKYLKTYPNIRKYSKVMIILKSIWLVIAFGVVVGYLSVSSDTGSAACEWTISYWYGFWPILIAVDFNKRYHGEEAEKSSDVHTSPETIETDNTAQESV